MASPSLSRKLTAVLLGLLAVLTFVSVTSTLLVTGRYLDEVDQRLNRDLAQHLVEKHSLLDGGRVQGENLKKILQMFMAVNPRIEVYLLDPEGRILAFDAPPGRVRRDRVSLAPVRQFLDGGRLPILGEDPRNPQQREVFSAAPILGPDGEMQGYLYIVLVGEQYGSLVERMQGSYILRLTVWTSLGSLLLAVIAGIALFTLLTRRLRALDRRIQEFEATGFQDPPAPRRRDLARPAPRGDEIDRLDRTFRQMAERIVAQMEDLKQVDQLRRELVANVSHDLRTPLALLQGYLDTLLLKNETLSPEERMEYLQVAEAQSQRLGKLVTELFELARLDSGDTSLEAEDFSLAELAQDLTQKHRLQAAEKEVELVARLPPDVPFVHADLRLIERALENLLGNALRYTDSGGSIEVNVAADGDRVTVEVSDTGCGIPAEDLPHIFDRFYRGKGLPPSTAKDVNGRDRPSSGAGLGLAIAQRILELHASHIRVDSTVGLGTRFSFDLPVS